MYIAYNKQLIQACVAGQTPVYCWAGRWFSWTRRVHSVISVDRGFVTLAHGPCWLSAMWR